MARYRLLIKPSAVKEIARIPRKQDRRKVIERIEALSAAAEVVLTEIPTGRIRLKAGDGSAGWPYYAPFDKIIVSAATAERPAELLSQLAGNGCLIAPVQDVEEQLVLYRRRGDEFEEQKLSRCSFVPLLKGVG